MPLVVLICSAKTRISHAAPRRAHGHAQPDEEPGQGPGDHHPPDDLEPVEADHLGQLVERGVDLAHRGVGVDVDGEHGAEDDQRDLRGVADAEPQDDQRLEADDGHETQCLHGGVHHVVADARQPGDDPEDGARGDPDGQADEHPLEGSGELEGPRTPASAPILSKDG